MLYRSWSPTVTIVSGAPSRSTANDDGDDEPATRFTSLPRYRKTNVAPASTDSTPCSVTVQFPCSANVSCNTGWGNVYARVPLTSGSGDELIWLPPKANPKWISGVIAAVNTGSP